MLFNGLDIDKLLFNGVEASKVIFNGINVFDLTPIEPPIETVPNELVYTLSTYEEWYGSNMSKSVTGVTLTGAGSTAMINTTLSNSTKYGSLLTIVSNGTAGNFRTLGSVAGSVIIASAGLTGNFKNIITTSANIVTNRWGFYTDYSGGITIQDIRLFKLLVGSEIETDFTNLTADELNIKYPLTIDEESGNGTFASLSDLTWNEIIDEAWEVV